MEARAVTREMGLSRTWLVHNVRWAVAVLACLFVLVPVVLLARRIGGEFRVPLPGMGFVICGLVYAAAAFGLRRAADVFVTSNESAALGRTATWLPPLCLLGFVAAIWLPGTSGWAVAITVVALIAEEGWAWRTRPSSRGFRRVARPLGGVADEAKLDANGALESAGAELDETVLQRLTHGRSDEGHAFWHGVIRAEFLPDQRVAAALVAFCPPFADPPDVSAWHLNGPPAEVRVTQALANGARLEIKLQRPAEQPCSAVIEFTAQDRPNEILTSG